MKILELFAGIGGVAEAVRQTPQLGQIGQAVDIDQQCGEVYALNFGLRPTIATIESAASWHSRIDWQTADTWWLSPPCQPYCRRGRQAADDPRRAALLQVMQVLRTAGTKRPQRIAMENVPEFQASADHQTLCQVLGEQGYRFTEHLLCPTQWGVPNRRRRYYLTAWQAALSTVAPPPVVPARTAKRFRLEEILEPDPAEECWLAPERVEKYRSALDIVVAEANDADASACTACFTGGYGKSIKQAGSYLQVGPRLRRFTPLEIQRLLGFSAGFQWPPAIPLHRRWKMLGNSLSVPLVGELLRSLQIPASQPKT